MEGIYELIQYEEYAGTADIPEYLSVSSPSVTKMVKKLDENQYLTYEFLGQAYGGRNVDSTKYRRKNTACSRNS